MVIQIFSTIVVVSCMLCINSKQLIGSQARRKFNLTREDLMELLGVDLKLLCSSLQGKSLEAGLFLHALKV